MAESNNNIDWRTLYRSGIVGDIIRTALSRVEGNFSSSSNQPASVQELLSFVVGTTQIINELHVFSTAQDSTEPYMALLHIRGIFMGTLYALWSSNLDNGEYDFYLKSKDNALDPDLYLVFNYEDNLTRISMPVSQLVSPYVDQLDMGSKKAQDANKTLIDQAKSNIAEPKVFPDVPLPKLDVIVNRLKLIYQQITSARARGDEEAVKELFNERYRNIVHLLRWKKQNPSLEIGVELELSAGDTIHEYSRNRVRVTMSPRISNSRREINNRGPLRALALAMTRITGKKYSSKDAFAMLVENNYTQVSEFPEIALLRLNHELEVLRNKLIEEQRDQQEKHELRARITKRRNIRPRINESKRIKYLQAVILSVQKRIAVLVNESQTVLSKPIVQAVEPTSSVGGVIANTKDGEDRDDYDESELDFGEAVEEEEVEDKEDEEPEEHRVRRHSRTERKVTTTKYYGEPGSDKLGKGQRQTWKRRRESKGAEE